MTSESPRTTELYILPFIASNDYNALLLDRIKPDIEKILRENQNCFLGNRSTTLQILTIRRVIEEVSTKNLEAILLFADFSETFDFIDGGKMKQILLVHSLPQRNRFNFNDALQKHESKGSLLGDKDFLDIVVGFYKTIIDEDYADDLLLHVNAPARVPTA